MALTGTQASKVLVGAQASKVLGWPKRYQLAHAFLSEYRNTAIKGRIQCCKMPGDGPGPALRGEAAAAPRPRGSTPSQAGLGV